VNALCRDCHEDEPVPGEHRAEVFTWSQDARAGRPEHLPGFFLRMPVLVEPLCADCHGRESIFLYKFFHSEATR